MKNLTTELSGVDTYDLQEWQLERLENGYFRDTHDDGTSRPSTLQFTALDIGRDILDYLSKLAPGQYYVQIWTKEHHDRSWDEARENGYQHGRLDEADEAAKDAAGVNL